MISHETIKIEGIWFRSQDRTHVALVHDDDCVPEIIYGDDPVVMAEAIGRLYMIRFGRKPLGRVTIWRHV